MGDAVAGLHVCHLCCALGVKSAILDHAVADRLLVTPCAGSGFSAKFNFACQKSAVPLARNAGAVTAYLASLFAGDSNEIFPYGVDPAFLRSSEALYRPEFQGLEGRFYNVSDPAQVPNATNTPHGFHHRHLKVGHGPVPGCS